MVGGFRGRFPNSYDRCMSKMSGVVLRAAGLLVLVVLWLGLTGVGGPFFGRVSEVSSNDPAAYLPGSAQATLVQGKLQEFTGSAAAPAVLVVASVDDREITAEQLEVLADVSERAARTPGFAGRVSPPVPSGDGVAAQVFLQLPEGVSPAQAVEAFREDLGRSLTDAGLRAHVTGPAGFAADLAAGFKGIDGLLLVVALVAVFLILVVVYRSPVLPVLVLLTSVSALAVALLCVWWLAKFGVFALSGQTQGILFILVIGAATDYSLLYVSRFREALSDTDRWQATRRAWRGALEPVVASGATVVAGLLCLLFSDLESNRALGPVAAIGVLFSVLASLSLLPALLYFFGGVAFWPAGRVRGFGGGSGGLWRRVASFVAGRSRPVWVLTVLLLVVSALGVSQLRADGVPASELVLGQSDARDGQRLLGEHFPGGSGSPVQVLVSEDGFVAAARKGLGMRGVSAASVYSGDVASGFVPLDSSGGVPVAGPFADARPKVYSGDVLLQLTLEDAADTDAAKETVTALRAALPDALVGGQTAISIDSDAASIHDRNLIIPLVLLVITLILMLLLRSVVAPLLLLGTVVLSFAATLGVSAVFFNEVLGMPGADPAVPLYGFVFLVALGIDYNIFLMTRVREAALVDGTVQGIGVGLERTGGVITSAGIVLAATFAALSVIPILFLLQLAIIVAFGVLVDTLLVRTLLVPALSHEFSRRLWWPARRPV